MTSFGNAKVVEYLEPLMSKELLCKFPDNSAFDFDYEQSSIWSPLVTRAYTNSPGNLDFFTPNKLDNESRSEGILSITEKKKKKKKKRKIGITNTNGFAVNLSALKIKKRTNKNLVSDLSPSSNSFKGACNPVTRKVWNKVLKAATKHFKRRKRDSTAHVRLSNSMAKENIW